MLMTLLLDTSPSASDWLSVRRKLLELDLRVRLSDPVFDVFGRCWIFATVTSEELRLPLLSLLSNFGISSVDWLDANSLLFSNGVLRTLSPVVVRTFSSSGEVFYYYPLYDEFWEDLSGISVLDYDARYVPVQLGTPPWEGWFVEVVFETDDPKKIALIVEKGWGEWDGGLGMVMPYGALQDMAVFTE